MIFIYSKLLYVSCFILLFTSSSPSRKDQLPFHIYFSTKTFFQVTFCVRLPFCMLLCVVGSRWAKIRSGQTFAFSFAGAWGVIKGFIVKKGNIKKKQPFPYRESNPGRLGENQES